MDELLADSPLRPATVDYGMGASCIGVPLERLSLDPGPILAYIATRLILSSFDTNLARRVESLFGNYHQHSDSGPEGLPSVCTMQLESKHWHHAHFPPGRSKKFCMYAQLSKSPWGFLVWLWAPPGL